MNFPRVTDSLVQGCMSLHMRGWRLTNIETELIRHAVYFSFLSSRIVLINQSVTKTTWPAIVFSAVPFFPPFICAQSNPPDFHN